MFELFVCIFFEAAHESIAGSLSTTFDLCKISVSAKVVICHWSV